jgi:iron complex outermembrane recepter protein
VLRGPAVLLYGSQAIGGAVNVIDKRIPTRMPDEDFHFDAFAGVDSAADLRTGAASLMSVWVRNLVLHVDGSWRKADDMRIGGFQVAPGCAPICWPRLPRRRKRASLEEAEELREAAGQRGFVPN